MKLKLVAGAILLCGVSAAADAAPAAGGLNLGGVLLPLNNLANLSLPVLNPLVQPVLSLTAPVVDNLVPALHPSLVQLAPLFTTVDSLAGVVTLPAVNLNLPGLPN